MQERPFSFKLSFSRHSSVAASLGQENGAEQLLHRLAAKYNIEELTLADAKPEEVVAISKAFNLISKHTSFVGVDKESRVPMRPPPANGDSDSMSDVEYCEDDSDESNDNAPPSSAQKTVVAPPPAARVVPKTVTLASLQTFNGSWKADEMKLWETLGMDRNVLMKEKPSSWNENEFVTVLVLAYLQLRLDQEKDEWTLFAEKAIKWINGLRGKSEVTVLIDALKAKISLFPTA